MNKTTRNYLLVATILAVAFYYAFPYLNPVMDQMRSAYRMLPHF
jgi:hypothetical protein